MNNDDTAALTVNVTLTSTDTFGAEALRDSLQARLDSLNADATRRRLNLRETSERRALVEYLVQLDRQLTT